MTKAFGEALSKDLQVGVPAQAVFKNNTNVKKVDKRCTSPPIDACLGNHVYIKQILGQQFRTDFTVVDI
jgi:hypothetical protein